AWELIGSPAPSGNTLAARITWDASHPELFELYPFAHELLYEARLEHGRLDLHLTTHAIGADRVPLAFGFHPYLSLPGAPRTVWQVELPAMRRLALDGN